MLFMRPLIRYADFRGRARRGEYWGFFLFQSLIGGLFAGLAILLLTRADQDAAALGFLGSIGLGGLAALAFAIPQLAVTVRRLHDTGRSAWWLLLQAPGALAPLMFIGSVMGVIEYAGQGSSEAAAAVMSTAAGGLLLLAIAGFCNMILLGILWMPGQFGENRFGPDPRDPDGRALSTGPSYGGLSEDRLDQLFAEARREAMPVSSEARWRPEFDFGPDPQPDMAALQPSMREVMSDWDDLPADATFGKRRL